MEIIKGKTQKGQALGRQMGFPTINVTYDGSLRGVFAGKFLMDGRSYVAALNIGGRPTMSDDEILCEAFLLDFEGVVEDGAEIEVRVGEKIREIKKFDSADELKRQIANDVALIRKKYQNHL